MHTRLAPLRLPSCTKPSAHFAYKFGMFVRASGMQGAPQFVCSVVGSF